MGQDQEASFEYIQWREIYKTEKPFEIFIDLPPELRNTQRTNLIFEPVAKKRVVDVRGHEDRYNLDTHGFTFKTHQTSIEDLNTRDTVVNQYFPEIEDLIRNTVDGADRIYIFDWRTRASTEPDKFLNRTIDLNSNMDPLYPARYPHIDQSARGAVNRCYYHLKHEAEALLRGRFRIINIWRPLYRVEEWPLAVCDARTVQPTDTIISDFIRRKYVGETCFVQYNQDQKWYYLSKQERHEVVVMKIYDSSNDVEAKFCCHSSFRIQEDEPLMTRESIEVRAMVFTYSKEYKLPEQPLMNLRFMPTILVRRHQRKEREARLLRENREAALINTTTDDRSTGQTRLDCLELTDALIGSEVAG